MDVSAAVMTGRRQGDRPDTSRGRPDEIQSLQASLERQILRGLVAEWTHARQMLPSPLQKSMRRPLFVLREMRRNLGSWHAGRREIALSRDLATRHGWDDIKEVLLHEMAHQLAHEGFGALAEAPHGRSFQRACRLLRANPAASGAYAPLHARLARQAMPKARDRIVARIHKLMALAGSSNPNEAHAAMCKAHALIARHNVDLIRQSVRQAYVSVFLGAPRLRHFREAYHLAHLLQDYYFVQGVWVPAWVLDKGKMGRVLEISGSPKNVKISEYVHSAVRQFIDSAWSDYRRGKGLNRYRKTDFAVGIIDGFRSRLQKAVTVSRPIGGPADAVPVVIADRALNRYVAHRYPHLRSVARAGPEPDARILADGTERGKRLIIAKAIQQRDAFRGRVLTNRRTR